MSNRNEKHLQIFFIKIFSTKTSNYFKKDSEEIFISIERNNSKELIDHKHGRNQIIEEYNKLKERSEKHYDSNHRNEYNG